MKPRLSSDRGAPAPSPRLPESATHERLKFIVDHRRQKNPRAPVDYAPRSTRWISWEPVLSKPSLPERLAYSFDNSLARCPVVIIAYLALLSIGLIVVLVLAASYAVWKNMADQRGDSKPLVAQAIRCRSTSDVRIRPSIAASGMA